MFSLCASLYRCRAPSSEKLVFRWFYKVFRLTVFSLHGSTMVRGATHAAPAGNVDSPLVLQGSPCKIANAQLLGIAAGPFPRRGRIGDLLVFPMLFGCFMETVFCRFFRPGVRARNRCFYKVLARFQGRRSFRPLY